MTARLDYRWHLRAGDGARLLADDTGAIRTNLVPFHDALTTAERPRHRPGLAVPTRRCAHCWNRPAATSVRSPTPSLDGLPADKTLAHLRSALVATGAHRHATNGW
jgi:hypothetical protein